jgi:hypothetical protein
MFYWDYASLISYTSEERELLLQLLVYRFMADFGFAIILIPILGLQMLLLFSILIVGAICISRY